MPNEMKDNPFYYLKAIEQVEHFCNRRSEVGDALGLLRKSESVEIIGPRRIGKTSFLRYISHPTVQQECGMNPRRNVFVYIDCQHRPIKQEESRVYERMLECIVDAAHQVGVDLAPEPCDELWPEIMFEQALKEMSDRRLRTILLLDEFEVMARNSNLDVSFFNNLRALVNASDISVVYVTASRTSLGDLCLEHKYLSSSPFFNIFRPIRLGLFSEQDSRHLVEDSLRRVSARFPQEWLELVLEVGGGHPFFLQMAGYYAFKLAVAGEELTDDKRKALMEAVNSEAVRYFKTFWQKLDDQAQYVLAGLPLSWQDQSYQETIEHLRDECLIVRRNYKYEHFSPLFETFVQNQQVSGILQAGPVLVDQHREQILLRGELLSLSSTNYALLTCLVQRVGEVVSYEDLGKAAWLEEPYNLTERVKSAIKSLRKALGDDADCIVNWQGVGYLFQISQE